ncbi:MAG: class I SAM-dependent methyltransferase [bacterium]
MSHTNAVDSQTIADFGDQWTRYTDNAGFYGSAELMKDILGPLVNPENIAGQTVADIGSGTGRIVHMLLSLGARTVLAVEPSEAFEILNNNTAHCRDRVELLKAKGDALERSDAFDFVFSIGVLHHIVDPVPTLKACYKALKPGGRMVAWLYGYEGNEAYVHAVQLARTVTKRLPARSLSALARVLTLATDGYTQCCRLLPLPMAGYLVNVFSKFPPDKRRLVIYDQLNPAHAKYYRRAEAERLFRDAGFVDLRLHHRHGYSWTVVGQKPE